jgi:hypothetical protein
MGAVINFAIFVAISVVIVVVFLYLEYASEKKRTEAMQQYAQSRGFTFEGAAPSLQRWMQGFKLFNRGHSRVLKNVMLGVRDRADVAVGDYRYRTSYGRHSRVHHQTICVVRHPGLRVPHFFLRRQVPLYDALGKLFGGQDINFDEDPAFSKAFVLQTSGEEQAVRRFFNERARSHFTSLAGRSVQVEGVGDTLLIHFGKRLDVEDIDGLVADAINTARLWASG